MPDCSLSPLLLTIRVIDRPSLPAVRGPYQSRLAPIWALRLPVRRFVSRHLPLSLYLPHALKTPINAHSPDMARTCCPQYTIRLSASTFRPGKHLRRTLTKFNRYILTGSEVRSAGTWVFSPFACKVKIEKAEATTSQASSPHPGLPAREGQVQQAV